MKILCVADHVDPLIYSNSLKERYDDVDLILGAGDLDLEYYGFIVSTLNKPLYFVFGNHNLDQIKYYRKEFLSEFDEISVFPPSYGSQYLGGKVKRYKNLLLAGLGGCYRYNRGPNQFTDFGMAVYMLRLLPGLLWNKIRYGRFLDILLTHAPPSGINDKTDLCHRGFKVFLFFLKIFKPKFLIHGHIHLWDRNENRKERYMKTEIINAYDHIVFEFPGESDG